jgi:hypothetical protein
MFYTKKLMFYLEAMLLIRIVSAFLFDADADPDPDPTSTLMRIRIQIPASN